MITEIFYDVAKLIKMHRSGLLKTAIVLVVVVFLYTPIAHIEDYSVTIGGVAAALLLCFALARIRYRSGDLAYLFLIFAYPVLVYCGHWLSGSIYAVDGFRFFKSYALWCASVLIMFSGFRLDPKVVGGIGWRFVLCVVLLPAIFQYVLRKFFGSGLGFEMVAPFIEDRLEILDGDLMRAIGTYYEPSMLGRVTATLCAIVLMTERRAAFPAAAGVVAVVVSQSFAGLSLLLMTFATYFSSVSKKGLAAAAILIVVMYGFSQFIEERSSGVFDPSYNSTYVRLILPLDAMSQLLAEYPFGVPFGSNSLVVQNTIAGTVANFEESKITNGIYELFLYTGIPGVLAVLYIFILAVRNIIRGHRERALSQLFLLFGTVASSSLLSVESSLLTALIILAARNAVDNRGRVPSARSPQQLSPARSRFAVLQDR